jgi:hypothetical protein
MIMKQEMDNLDIQHLEPINWLPLRGASKSFTQATFNLVAE